MWRSYVTGLAVSGLLVLSFSTRSAADPFAVAGATIVVSYGLPFLALAAIGGLVAFFSGAARLSPRLRWTALAGAIHVGVIVWFSGYSPSVAGMVARCAGAALGFALFLYLCALASSTDSEADRHQVLILWAAALSGAVMAAYYIANFAVRSVQYGLPAVITSRVVGGLAALPWHASNVVAGAMLYPLFLLFQVRPTSPLQRAAKHVTFTLLSAALLLTMSLGAIGCAAVFLVLSLPRRRWFAAGIGAALALGLVFGALKYWLGESFSLFETVAFDLGTGSGDISNHRVEGYLDTWRYFLAHPFTPVGYGASSATVELGAHNIWLAYLVEMGPAGPISLAVLVILLAHRAQLLRRAMTPEGRRSGWLFLVGFGAVFLHMMVETPIYTQQASVYFWTAAGLLVAQSVRSAREERAALQ